jgi:ABC-type sugar transport system ATPase subunit
VLSVRGLSGAGFVENVSFDLRAGEILGFFGLVGGGRSEVAEMLFGITAADRGTIKMEGQPVRIGSPRKAIRMGMSFLPEDRHQQGLVLPFSIRANETLPILRQLSRMFGIVDRNREAQLARDFSERVRVVATGIEQMTSALSGGNQQKVLLAKWLIPSPRILILDQPTRGIDVGAKAEIHRIISRLAAQGMAIIFISDDVEEIIAMSDRILVFRAGRVESEFTRHSFDREAMLLAAAHAARDIADALHAE